MSLRDFGWNEFVFLMMAARWTLALSLIAFVGGGLVGLLVAVLRIVPNAWVRRATAVYIEVVQGTPLLIQLFVAYFGTSFIGYRPDAWAAAALVFVLNSAAFFGEIWRGSVAAVPSGQWECAKALGLSWWRTLRLVVAPQAVRIAIPPTVGYMVQIVKTTSLASLVGVVELARAATMVNTVTFEPVRVFGTVALVYFLMCWPLSLVSQRLEARLAAPER